MGRFDPDVEAVELGGGPLAQMVLGYAELAALRGARGEAAIRRALQDESWNPLELLGLGLASLAPPSRAALPDVLSLGLAEHARLD